MNEGQIKTRIFLMLAVDWLLFIAVFSVGIYSILYDSENRMFLGLAAFIGLLLVVMLGNYILPNVARLRVDLEKQRRLREKLEKSGKK